METLGEVQPAVVIETGTGHEIAVRGVSFEHGAVHLVASECTACSARAWPPSSRCHSCWNDVRAIALSTTGTLYAFTRVHVGADAAHLPYAIGYVDTPEGVRVYSRLREEHAPLAIDATVELRGEKHDGGIRFWYEVKA